MRGAEERSQKTGARSQKRGKGKGHPNRNFYWLLTPGFSSAPLRFLAPPATPTLRAYNPSR